MERLDAQACRDLRGCLRLDSAMFLAGDQPAAVMTGILRELSVLVTSRYHAAVLSMEHACPIVSVSMDERLDGIMKELSLDSRLLLHVDEKDLGARISQALSLAIQQQPQIRKRIQRCTEKNRLKLSHMGTFLKEYLER